MRLMPRLLAVLSMLLGTAGAARATDVPIIGLKSIVVNKAVGHGNGSTQIAATL